MDKLFDKIIFSNKGSSASTFVFKGSLDGSPFAVSSFQSNVITIGTWKETKNEAAHQVFDKMPLRGI